jgi:hypothetical protein
MSLLTRSGGMTSAVSSEQAACTDSRLNIATSVFSLTDAPFFILLPDVAMVELRVVLSNLRRCGAAFDRRSTASGLPRSCLSAVRLRGGQVARRWIEPSPV